MLNAECSGLPPSGLSQLHRGGLGGRAVLGVGRRLLAAAPALAQAVRLVRRLVHRYLAHEEDRHETRRREPDHRLPDGRQARRERIAHFALELVREVADHWDGGVRDFDTLGESRQELRGEAPAQLVLKNASRNGDAPSLVMSKISERNAL